jgi:hypothetical protein
MMLLDVVICDHDQDQESPRVGMRVTMGMLMMPLDVVICDHDQDRYAA